MASILDMFDQQRKELAKYKARFGPLDAEPPLVKEIKTPKKVSSLQNRKVVEEIEEEDSSEEEEDEEEGDSEDTSSEDTGSDTEQE